MSWLNRVYIGICFAVASWFGVAAHEGRKMAPIIPTIVVPGGALRGGGSPSTGYHGYFGGSRSSGGSWGGGK